ncbi:MAG TPA: phosphopentomutase [Anaerolineae bacterium]|nr:phosphopentomutase [Anaerolineae bacterium]HOQ98394.1 phosphopentomutase [Anaerolineae bacterium]HPL26494.1 phosphopentomutase [Anaerolineae bacterium]
MIERKRAILIVLDSVGCGAMPDAAAYGDEGANTLGNIKAHYPALALPNLDSLGLGRLVPALKTGAPVQGAWGKAATAGQAKDTVSGHWELGGYIQEPPFRTYPNGFPPEVIAAFCARAGVPGALGNVAASGTEIIERLGREHLRSGLPIVYTSADSVFQIAAHEAVLPPPRLYELCHAAREVLQPPHSLVGQSDAAQGQETQTAQSSAHQSAVGSPLVARVIARPFAGEPGSFVRTENRRDFVVAPAGHTLLDLASAAGLPVVAVGKIEDVFCRRGISLVDHTGNNAAGTEATIRFLHEGPDGGLIFANLVDFDSAYGHRRNVAGYAQALMAFDAALPAILAALRPRDLLIITADHGCDPTITHHTDHTREYVPILCAGHIVQPGRDVGTRATMADVGATLAEWLGLGPLGAGVSFLRCL